MDQKFNENYLKIRDTSQFVIVEILQKNPELVKDFLEITGRERMRIKVKNWKNDKLFEIAGTYGYGDNGRGYYRLHLILNLKNFEEGKYSEIFYLAVSYVPEPDIGHSWEVLEVHERDMSNFSPVHVFVKYMEKFTKSETALAELKILAQRTSSIPVKNRAERTLATA